jgi:hypothetical protein
VAQRGILHLPAARSFAFGSSDRTATTPADCAPSTPLKEEKGFGAFACHPITGERAKTSCGSAAVPARSRLRVWNGPRSVTQIRPPG